MSRKKILRLVLIYSGSAEGPDALWKITRDGRDDRPEWREFKQSLRIQVDELDVMDLPMLIDSAISTPPCIVGRYSSGWHSVIFTAPMIRRCWSVKSLIAALRDYGEKYNVDLGFHE